jgi:hypothetical protein
MECTHGMTYQYSYIFLQPTIQHNVSNADASIDFFSTEYFSFSFSYSFEHDG